MSENDNKQEVEDTTSEELEDNSQDHEDNREGEGDDTKSEVSDTESPEDKRARLNRQIKREAKKQGVSVKEFLGQEDKESGKEDNKEKGSKKEVDVRYERLELKTEGITSKKAQDIVIDYAQYKGIEISEALNTPAIKAELAELEKKTSTPPPSKRTGKGATDTLEYWISQAKKGNFPTDNPEMMDKLKKARIFTS